MVIKIRKTKIKKIQKYTKFHKIDFIQNFYCKKIFFFINFQNSGGEFNESELAAMLEQSNLEEAPGEFLPFMQGMMQSLLSKEVLYPSLKDLVEKYPQWLEEKKDTLSSEDFTRYSKQLELMGKVILQNYFPY